MIIKYRQRVQLKGPDANTAGQFSDRDNVVPTKESQKTGFGGDADEELSPIEDK